MTDSPNLALPYIDGGEAQPFVTHNDAVRALDALVQLAVLDRDLAAPPGSPTDGQRWIVAASPTGAWAGHATQVAAWQDGAWEFYLPRTGWFAYVLDEGTLLAFNGTAWVDAMAILTALQNLTLLGVGTTADATNPLSAKLNNTLWTAKTVAEGGDGNLRYKMSKESAAKTLSLLLQDNFSGRAEIGLTGDDDCHVKVSADGSTWVEALVIDRTTGKLKVAGDVAVNTNKFAVTASSGNTAIAGAVTMTAGTASSSTTTGTLVVTGGAGISGKAYVGGALTVTDSTASSSVSTGSGVFSGGVGVTGAAYVGGVLNVAGASTLGGNVGITGTLSASGNFAIATSKFTVAASSGNTVVAGTLGVTGATSISSSTASTTTSTGALVVTGGAGIGGAANFGGAITVGTPVITTGIATFRQSDDTNLTTGLRVERNTNDSALVVGYRSADDAFVLSATFGTTGAYLPIVLKTSGTTAVTVATSGAVKLAGDLTVRPSASVTPAANGDLMIQATSNTSLTFKYKGSDGTVRSASLTLS